MKVAMTLFAAISLCMLTFAIDEFGSLDAARKEHPAIFVPGNVLEYSVGDVPGYVFNGEAERFFEGGMAESDSELYQEAVLDAKSNLLKFLKQKSKIDSLQMKGVVKLYEYSEGKMRRVVLFVAKKDVSMCLSQSVCLSQENAVRRDDDRDATKMQSDKGGVAQEPPKGVDPSATLKTNLAVEATALGKPKTAEVNVSVTAKVDKITVYLKQIADNPNDCIAMSKAAKLYARQGGLVEAKVLYSKIVNLVIADERMDKEFASGLLMEAARFEKGIGDVNLALKYYRLLIRCDGLRRWKLTELVDEANRNISQLLTTVF